jgi:hypothetical protein
MKARVINGFTVVEALGSGQGGILYLARDGEGREAVIRVARDGEDNVAIRVFIEEAKQLLPSATDVETTVASDGRRILMARATPLPGTLASRPPPAAETPGTGFTRYAATERLPDPAPPPAPSASSRAPLLLLLAALVVFGAGASMVVLALRSPALAPPAEMPTLSTPDLDAGKAAEVAEVVTLPPPPEPEPVAKVRPTSAPTPPVAARADANRAGVRPCVFDVQWRRAAETDLRGYRRLAASLGPRAFSDFENDEDTVSLALSKMQDGADCRGLDAQLQKLTDAWDKRLEKHQCMPDAAWRSASEARLATSGLPESERTALAAEIKAATDWADCLRINQRLASVP